MSNHTSPQSTATLAPVLPLGLPSDRFVSLATADEDAALAGFDGYVGGVFDLDAHDMEEDWMRANNFG